MKETLAIVEHWASEHRQQINTGKCGLMVTGYTDFIADLKVEQTEARDWYIAGNPLPIISEYKYLGILFNSDLNLDKVASDICYITYDDTQYYNPNASGVIYKLTCDHKARAESMNLT